jgi:hypothetical protein
MPRYFFHTQTETRTSDDEGLELANDICARREAVRTCGEMMRDAPEGFWGTRPWVVTVTNDVGRVMWEIYMDGVETSIASLNAPS